MALRSFEVFSVDRPFSDERFYRSTNFWLRFSPHEWVGCYAINNKYITWFVDLEETNFSRVIDHAIWVSERTYHVPCLIVKCKRLGEWDVDSLSVRRGISKACSYGMTVALTYQDPSTYPELYPVFVSSNPFPSLPTNIKPFASFFWIPCYSTKPTNE